MARAFEATISSDRPKRARKPIVRYGQEDQIQRPTAPVPRRRAPAPRRVPAARRARANGTRAAAAPANDNGDNNDRDDDDDEGEMDVPAVRPSGAKRGRPLVEDDDDDENNDAITSAAADGPASPTKKPRLSPGDTRSATRVAPVPLVAAGSSIASEPSAAPGPSAGRVTPTRRTSGKSRPIGGKDVMLMRELGMYGGAEVYAASRGSRDNSSDSPKLGLADGDYWEDDTVIAQVEVDTPIKWRNQDDTDSDGTFRARLQVRTDPDGHRSRIAYHQKMYVSRAEGRSFRQIGYIHAYRIDKPKLGQLEKPLFNAEMLATPGQVPGTIEDTASLMRAIYTGWKGLRKNSKALTHPQADARFLDNNLLYVTVVYHAQAVQGRKLFKLSIGAFHTMLGSPYLPEWLTFAGNIVLNPARFEGYRGESWGDKSLDEVTQRLVKIYAKYGLYEDWGVVRTKKGDYRLMGVTVPQVGTAAQPLPNWLIPAPLDRCRVLPNPGEQQNDVEQDDEQMYAGERNFEEEIGEELNSEEQIDEGVQEEGSEHSEYREADEEQDGVAADKENTDEDDEEHDEEGANENNEDEAVSIH